MRKDVRIGWLMLTEACVGGRWWETQLGSSLRRSMLSQVTSPGIREELSSPWPKARPQEPRDFIAPSIPQQPNKQNTEESISISNPSQKLLDFTRDLNTPYSPLSTNNNSTQTPVNTMSRSGLSAEAKASMRANFELESASLPMLL